MTLFIVQSSQYHPKSFSQHHYHVMSSVRGLEHQAFSFYDDKPFLSIFPICLMNFLSHIETVYNSESIILDPCLWTVYEHPSLFT